MNWTFFFTMLFVSAFFIGLIILRARLEEEDRKRKRKEENRKLDDHSRML